MANLDIKFLLMSMTLLQTEMALAWSFIKRKSDLLTTAVDLINADMVIAHNLLISTVLILFYMTSWVNEDFAWPPLLAYVIGIWFFFIASVTVTYYSLGISLRYFFIWKRRTYLIEDWTDQDVRKAAFGFALTIAVLPNGLHLAFGGNTRFYGDLTGNEENHDVRGLIIQMTTMFISIILNVTFRILIIRERRRDSLHESKKDLNGAMAILLFVIFLTIFLVGVLQWQHDPKAIANLRFFGGTFVFLGIPLIFMFSSSEFLQFTKRIMKSSWVTLKTYLFGKKATAKVNVLMI